MPVNATGAPGQADPSAGTWTGRFFLEVWRLAIEERGYYIFLVIFGGALGGVVGGFLNDFTIWLTGSYRWGRSLIGFTGKVIAAIWMLVAIQQADPTYAAWSLFCAKFFTDWSQPTVWGTPAPIWAAVFRQPFLESLTQQARWAGFSVHPCLVLYSTDTLKRYRSMER